MTLQIVDLSLHVPNDSNRKTKSIQIILGPLSMPTKRFKYGQLNVSSGFRYYTKGALIDGNIGQ